MRNGRASQIFEKLSALGVEEYCVCAGARNAPFVAELNASSGLKAFDFFDERSAAFFALGRVQRNQKPMAVVTTSGTAVAELLPAVIEAHYRNLPLILLTADRPASFRHSGAPQSILHVGIFSHYVSCTYDIGLTDYVPNFNIQDSPVHINVCFSEHEVNQSLENTSQHKYNPSVFLPHAKSPSYNELDRLNQFFNRAKAPLVIASGMSLVEAQEVESHLFKLQRPIYAESTSNLSGLEKLKPLLVQGGERALSSNLFFKQFDSIIRLGSVPTCRLWRDLEDSLVDLPVISVSRQGFSGLAREVEVPLSFTAFLKFISEWNEFPKANLEPFLQIREEINSLLLKYPFSEAGQIYNLSKAIPEKEQIFLGNSLPIREWDMVGIKKPRQNYCANRGVNGIDGLVSTSLGWSSKDSGLWCVLGDLSSLYDLSGLWALKHSEHLVFRCVVMNNGGGKIFSRKFGHSCFENNHNLKFAGWADLFKLDYINTKDIGQVDVGKLPQQVIVEITPDNAQSDSYWVEYENIWKKY